MTVQHDDTEFYEKLFTDFAESLAKRGFVTEKQVDDYLEIMYGDGLPVPFDCLCGDLAESKTRIPDKDLDTLRLIYEWLWELSAEYDWYMEVLEELDK